MISYLLFVMICAASLSCCSGSGGRQFQNYQYQAGAGGGGGGNGGAPYDFQSRPPFSPPGYLLGDTERDDDELSFFQRIVRPWTWFSWLTERSDSSSSDNSPFDHYQELPAGPVGPYDRFGVSAAAGPYDTRYEAATHYRSPLSRLDQRHHQQQQQQQVGRGGGWPAGSQPAAAYKTARSDPEHQSLQIQQQNVRTSVESQQLEVGASGGGGGGGGASEQV